jgi:hypothetical protein
MSLYEKITKINEVDERKFLCEFPNCQKKFKEKGNLKTHLRIHVSN